MYTMRADDDAYVAQNNMYSNNCGSTYMSPAVQAVPTMIPLHNINGYECPEAPINSPGYANTSYSGTFSYPPSNAPELSPFASPLMNFANLSCTPMDSELSLNEGTSFMRQAGNSFGSYHSGPQYPSSFYGESVMASPRPDNCYQATLNHAMPGYHTDLVGIQSNSGSPTQPRAIPRPTELLISPMVSATDMQRSGSNRSTASMRSTKSTREERRRNTLKMQVVRGNRTPIAAKGTSPVASKGPSPAKGSGVGKKQPASRKKLPKVTCLQCGKDFRGDHELRRHDNSTHAERSEGWRIVDPCLQGKIPKVPLKNPLKGCKPCDTGRIYNAAHNACAHFRRGHCMEKPARRSNGKVAEEDKRGGKAVGDDPPAQVIYDFFLERVYLARNEDGSKREISAAEFNAYGTSPSGVVQGEVTIDQVNVEAESPVIVFQGDVNVDAMSPIGDFQHDTDADAVSPIGVFQLEDIDGGITTSAFMEDDVSQAYETPSEMIAFSLPAVAAPSDFLSYNVPALDHSYQ